MSTHAAIAAVTATLTGMLQSAVSNVGSVAGAKVTARPPDRARQGTTGNQINLFLYRTTIDAAWRNQDPPTIRPGESGQPPLPLILSYLITAYGDNDDEILGHRLLGIAMGVLNDRPLLSRNDVRDALPAPGSGLDEQLERVRITPDPRPQDEISRMWATFGTGYRLSVSYDAAVVLIDSTRETVAPTPVLSRGTDDSGPVAIAATAPQIDLVLPPGGQAAARPGDVVKLLGRNLGAVSALQATGLRMATPVALAVRSASATAIELEIPASPPEPLPAGTVAIAAMIDGGAGSPIAGVPAPLALAPTIVTGAALKAKLGAGAASLKVKCAPPVQPGQTVALIVGDRIVPGVSPTKASSELTFALAGFEKGTYTLRLRVDGVDSIPVAASKEAGAQPPAPMEFDNAQRVVLS